MYYRVLISVLLLTTWLQAMEQGDIENNLMVQFGRKNSMTKRNIFATQDENAQAAPAQNFTRERQNNVYPVQDIDFTPRPCLDCCILTGVLSLTIVLSKSIEYMYS